MTAKVKEKHEETRQVKNIFYEQKDNKKNYIVSIHVKIGIIYRDQLIFSKVSPSNSTFNYLSNDI